MSTLKTIAPVYEFYEYRRNSIFGYTDIPIDVSKEGTSKFLGALDDKDIKKILEKELIISPHNIWKRSEECWVDETIILTDYEIKKSEFKGGKSSSKWLTNRPYEYIKLIATMLKEKDIANGTTLYKEYINGYLPYIEQKAEIESLQLRNQAASLEKEAASHVKTCVEDAKKNIERIF